MRKFFWRLRFAIRFASTMGTVRALPAGWHSAKSNDEAFKDGSSAIEAADEELTYWGE